MKINELTGTRWAAEGFYRLAGGKFSPEYVCAFWDRKVVWEFEDKFLMCYIDGHLDHSVQYTVSPDGLLQIYYPILIPYFYQHIRRYRIVRYPEENAIWLHDTDKTSAETVDNLTIKLVPVE